MKLATDDQVNRDIWARSCELQRAICASSPSNKAGSQQTMPKAADAACFGSENPLPWVPDLVGQDFAAGAANLLVVGSSYNGFITGYSGRSATMELQAYADARDAGDMATGHAQFLAQFVASVVNQDETYYQPILRDLLPKAGINPEKCCLTDLCKASFVERGNGPGHDNRGDMGSDGVLRQYWKEWEKYLACGTDGAGAPLPYHWLWQRMQQCRHILALGTIAEYGILKIFCRMGQNPKVWSWKERAVVPNNNSIKVSEGWEYGYACTSRHLSSWLQPEDWWVLADPAGCPRWFMLPVYHPSATVKYGCDRGYQETGKRLRAMLNSKLEQ